MFISRTSTLIIYVGDIWPSISSGRSISLSFIFIFVDIIPRILILDEPVCTGFFSETYFTILVLRAFDTLLTRPVVVPINLCAKFY